MNKKGLSMIEIIVSVALIGLIATGLLSVATSYVSMLYDSKEITKELLFAQQDMEREIEHVKTQIENGVTPADEDSYVLFGGTSYERTINGYLRQENVDNSSGILYTIITDNTIVYKTAQASNVEIKLWKILEVPDGYSDTTGLSVKSSFNLSDPDNVNLTNLNHWYVSREGYNIPVRYTPDEIEVGTKFPRFPDDYTIIPGEKNSNLTTIKDEYAGKHIIYTVTPASKSGKMGTTVPSNSVFISGLPVISDLALHLDAAMIDVTSSDVRISGDDIFVVKWYDQSSHENDGRQSNLALQPKLYDEKFGTFQGSYSKVYDTYARYIRFEDNDSIIVSDDSSLDLDSMTIYAVVRSSNRTDVKSIISKNDFTEGWDLGWTGPGYYGFQIGSGGTYESVSGNYNDGIDDGWHIIRADTSMGFKIDEGGTSSNLRTVGNITNGSPISIKWNGSTGFVDVAEIIIYDGTLSAAEKGEVDEYLHNKYQPDPPVVFITSLESPAPVSLIREETFVMPPTLVANMSNGTREDVAVNWSETIDTSTIGLKTSIASAVADNSKKATLAVTVLDIASLVDIDDFVMVGRPYVLPTVVEAILTDGSTDMVEVTWNPGNLSTSTVTVPGPPLTSVGTSILNTDKHMTLSLDVIPVGAESVTLSADSIDIVKGLYFDLTATVLPSDAPDKSVTWSSDAPAIASVDNSGRVTGNLEGDAIITVTTVDGGHTDTCSVTILPVPPSGVTLDKNTLALENEDTETLTATVSPPEAADRTVSWSSSDTSVASVSDNGDGSADVTANGNGNATITVTTNTGGLTNECIVTVTSNDAEIVQNALDTLTSLQVNNPTSWSPDIIAPSDINGVDFTFIARTATGGADMNISGDGKTANVDRDWSDETGTLTLQGELNGLTATKTFNVVIPRRRFLGGMGPVTVTE